MTDTPCRTIRGPMSDSSVTMAEAAVQGRGVALFPVCMFQRDLAAERLVQTFAIDVSAGSYWLTWLKSRPPDARNVSLSGLAPAEVGLRPRLLISLGFVSEVGHIARLHFGSGPQTTSVMQPSLGD